MIGDNYKLIRDYISASLGTILPAIFSLASLLMFSKTVGMEKFGSFVLIFSIVDLIDKLLGISTWQAFQRFSTDNEQKNLNLVYNLFLLDVFFSCCSFILSLLFIYLFSNFILN